MPYVDGFVLAVPEAKLAAYKEIARRAGEVWKEHGALSYVECVGDDTPYGEVTSVPRAGQATEDERIVVAWITYRSREERDAINAKVMADPRLQGSMEDMPFDGKRMIFGGFDGFVEEGSERGGYIDGFVTPVPKEKLDAYRELANKAAGLFRAHGALRDVEAIADDVPKGEVTDFYRAVKSEDGETFFFSFLEWPDKQARDEGWKKIMTDPRMKAMGEQMPFDGKRMIFGGFAPILDV